MPLHKIDKENIPQAMSASGLLGKQHERRLSLAMHPQCGTKLLEVITLDSSDEVIDNSLHETPKGFDWIQTPRLIKSRPENDENLTELFGQEKSVQKYKDDKIANSNGFATPASYNTNNAPHFTEKKYENSQFGHSKRRNVEQWLAQSQEHDKAAPPPLDPKVLATLRSVYGKHWSNEKRKGDNVDNVDNWSKRPDIKFCSEQKDSNVAIKQNAPFSVNPKVPSISSARKKLQKNTLSNRVVKKIVFEVDSPCSPKTVRTDHEDLMLMPDSPCVTSKTPETNRRRKRKRERSASNDEIDCNPAFRRETMVCPTPKRTFLASLSVSSPTSICHSDALPYKINFANKKEELCQRLFRLYNAEVFEEKLPSDLLISWNPKMRGTAGFCYNKKTTRGKDVNRTSRIELAPRVVDRADRLRDTLIHELCHAAAWIIDGVIDGHGITWSRWAKRSIERFPELPVIRRCHNYQIASKYTYRCTACGYSINRNSKSIDLSKKRCGHCGGALELFINKKKRGKTEEPEFDQTRTIKPANAFALFVQENYKRIKGSDPKRKHGEVMKILSSQYSVFKSVMTPGKKESAA